MIITTQSLCNTSTQGAVFIRALSSIIFEQAGIIALILEASARAWNVQAVDDYDGYLSIFIEPAFSEDEQKTMFISGTAQCLDLFIAEDDRLSLVSTFSDVKALGARLSELIASSLID